MRELSRRRGEWTGTGERVSFAGMLFTSVIIDITARGNLERLFDTTNRLRTPNGVGLDSDPMGQSGRHQTSSSASIPMIYYNGGI
jgi:hypothetical protein